MLAMDNICAGYDGHQVLHNVTLVVPDESVVALLGPNGAGKTTLLRVASGLLAPTRGTMRLDSQDVTSWAPERLARGGVCHVPEGRGVFPSLTVRDNLRLQAEPGADRAGVRTATEAFPRLGERLAQRAGTMSGGEQQMLALAAAYARDAGVVLLDEVSMGLAPKIVDEIFAHLQRLAASGKSMLLVEQYVARAVALADYVYVLNRGRIVFAGEPKELDDGQVLSTYFGESQ